MTTDTAITQEEPRKARVVYRGGASDAVYGFGLLGAWFYYISTATTFGMGVLGIFKGIFWPALLVYELLKFLYR